jgi:hypothetical protein
MCLVCAGQAVVALPLVFLVLLVAQAALAALFEPARNTVLPDVVGVDRVAVANGLMGVNSNVARLAGAWAGGLLLGWGTWLWA